MRVGLYERKMGNRAVQMGVFYVMLVRVLEKNGARA
jgi:hypothetical protein